MSIAMKAYITLAMVLGLFAAVIGMAALVVGLEYAIFGWALVMIGIVIAALVLPVRTSDLVSKSQPAAGYDDAVARFRKWTAKPEAPLSERCVPQLMVHGKPTEKVFVLIHGLSNCPYTFHAWAPELYAAGHTVMTPRMPYAGQADNAADALRHVTAKKLTAFCDECVDIASGLGREVIVLGISGGGILAGWVAQNRADVARAVLVAPAFGLAEFGITPNALLMRLVLLLPHVSVWKDPLLRWAGPSREHSYKRQSTRGTGEYMRLGLAVRRQAKAAPPKARSIVVVTNAADDSVDDYVTAETADLWQADGANLTRYEFPMRLELPHELVDPTEPGAFPARTYPVLTALCETGRPPTQTPQGRIDLKVKATGYTSLRDPPAFTPFPATPGPAAGGRR